MSEILSILPIPAFKDNYIWLIDTNEGYIVVDPGDAVPVMKAVGSSINKDLTILITHHHFDHTGGVETLKDKYRANVLGPKGSPFKAIDQALTSGDAFNLYGLFIEIDHIPGHTLDHIYYLIHDDNKSHLFCGDTVFSGGCGRVFEGTFKQMHDSLNKISALPNDTFVYPTHEYTLSNLKFALQAEPNNKDLQDYENHCQKLREQGTPTLPTSIKQELLINPFLRTHSSDIHAVLRNIRGIETTASEDVFSGLREWKDSF